MRYRTFILWCIFSAIFFLSALYITQDIFDSEKVSILDLGELTFVGKLILSLAVTLLILHSVWTLDISGGITFVILSLLTGLIIEVLGVNYGVVFGGYYVYDPLAYPRVLGVPFLIPLIWAGFIYAGYCIISSFYLWTDRTGFGGHPKRIWHKILFAWSEPLRLDTLG